MACSIALGSAFDCDDLPQAGVNSRLIIGNLADITVTLTANLSIASAITKTSVAFAFEGSDMSVKPSYTLVPGTIANQWTHKIEFVIFEVDGAQKQNLENMKNSTLYAITQNSDDSGNGDNFFELFGIGRGLRLTAVERIPTDNETLGAFKVTLETFAEGGNESNMPLTVFVTDFTASKAVVDALLI